MTHRQLDDVFGVSRDLPLNYVIRDSVDGQLVSALTRNQHIVVYGSSKQGKTCLRKYNLQDSDHISLTCSNKWTLPQLHSAVLKAAGYVVEGTTKQAISGEAKVSARLRGGFKLFGAKAEAEAETDISGATSKETESTPLELDPADVNDIIGALEMADCPQFIVLEDFHYLSEETQKDFAVALKAFHEDSSFCFIVVGVWKDANRLIQQNGDLTGRITAINADIWTQDELTQVIEVGSRLLNITFSDDFKNGLLNGCFDSIYVVQESCRRACEEASVFGTRVENAVIDGVASSLIKQAVDAHSARYNSFITNFSLGFQTSTLEMYRWLLWPVLQASTTELELGLKYGDLRLAINEHHPDAPINPGNITQALLSTASLQVGKMAIKPIILDYDQTNRRLNVVDRSFLIWRDHQDTEELLGGMIRSCGWPSAR